MDFKFILITIIICISIVFIAESCNRRTIAVANEKVHSTRDIRFGFHIKPPVNYDKQDNK